MEKILYVEDDISLIDGLQYTLETSGYAVDNARTVKEALALFGNRHYDLLLLDVTLPDGTGFDVCRQVRSGSTIPIIFLTASDQEISIVKGLDMGGDDYITNHLSLTNCFPGLSPPSAFPAVFQSGVCSGGQRYPCRPAGKACLEEEPED